MKEWIELSEKEWIKNSINPGNAFYDSLILSIGELLKDGRKKAARAVSNTMVHTYWEIGRQIVEYEQKGNVRAEYGSDVLNRLSRDLTDRYGKGFSRSNVYYIRKLYLTYPKVQTLSELLSQLLSRRNEYGRRYGTDWNHTRQ